MSSTSKKPTADEIADMADRGQDVSQYFTNKGTERYPVKRINIDFSIPMLTELDEMAGELNISRQAVIKSFLRQALDQHKLARS